MEAGFPFLEVEDSAYITDRDVQFSHSVKKKNASSSYNKIFERKAESLEQSDPEGGQVRRSERGPQAFTGLLTPAIKVAYIRFHTCGLLTFAGLFIHFFWLVNGEDAAFVGRPFIIRLRFHSGVRCRLP